MLLLPSLLVPLLATFSTAEYFHVEGTDFLQYVADSNFHVESYKETSAYGIPPPPGGVHSFALYLTDLSFYSQTAVYKIPSTGLVNFQFTFLCDDSASELEIRMSYPWQSENIHLCGPRSNIDHQPGEWVTGTFSRKCYSTCTHLDLWIYGGTLDINNIVGLHSISITTGSTTFPPTNGTTFITDSTTTPPIPTTTAPTTTTPTTTTPTTTTPTTTTPTTTTPTTTTPTTTTPTTTTHTTTTPTTTTPTTTTPTTTTPTTTTPTTTTPTTTTPTTTTPTTTTPTTTTPTTTTPTTTTPTTTTPTTTTPTTTTPTTTTPTTTTPSTTTPTTTTPSTTTPTTTTPTTTTPTTTTPTTTTPTTTTPTTTTPTTTTPTTTTPTTTTPTTTTPMPACYSPGSECASGHGTCRTSCDSNEYESGTCGGASCKCCKLYWPAGYYLLPRSRYGCPDNIKFTWYTGWSEQDTEGNNAHDSYYLAGWVNKNRIRKEFCMKNGAGGSGNWPSGNYCIYQYGGSCPSGFNGGYLEWEDRDLNGDNTWGGTRPDGIWDDDHTRVQYCCRNDGSYNTEIRLPTEDPFILLRNTAVCQKVQGMNSRTQFIKYDTENTDDDSYTSGDHPYICTYNKGCYTNSNQYAKDLQVHFCYYYK